MAEVILVTGGARSGKSTFAEKLALKIGNGRAAYIATAQIFDEEMAARVKIHRSRRSAAWTTFEAPFDADKIILAAAESFSVILFDCMTIYLSNWLCAKDLDDKNLAADFDAWLARLIDSAKNSRAAVIFVSNEVGAGIVPENKLARQFRDFAGLANQRIAAAADKVFLTVAGCAVDVKKLAAENNF